MGGPAEDAWVDEEDVPADRDGNNESKWGCESLGWGKQVGDEQQKRTVCPLTRGG